MSAMTTIAKREFRSNFDSPLAYVVICLSFLGLGLLFFLYRGGFWQLDRSSVGGIFDYAPLGLALLVVPVVTMRLLAEERRSGTLEMLITLPVSDSDVILGKYAGRRAGPPVVSRRSRTIAMFMWPGIWAAHWGPVLAGYVGLTLFAGASVAIGFDHGAHGKQGDSLLHHDSFFSELWFMGPGARSPRRPGELLEYVSFQTRLEGFARLIDTRDVVFTSSA
jgi:ABC-2 type transport system permease protein